MSKPDGNEAPGKKQPELPEGSGRRKPGWADGLKKLYDSVVDEPLPDSFDDLLKKLDGKSDD